MTEQPAAAALKQYSIPFFVPSVGETEIEAVVQTLRSGWLTSGPKVRQFEAEFAEYVGATYAVAVNSATATGLEWQAAPAHY